MKKPMTAESVVKKPVKVVEVDLGESDDERAEIPNLAGNGLICGVVRAAATVAAAAAGEGARARGRVGRTDSKTGEKEAVFEVMREEPKEPEKVGDAVEKPKRAVTSVSERYPVRVRRDPGAWYRAAVGAIAKDVGAPTEAVGAKEPEHGVEKTLPEKSGEVRSDESESSESGSVWVTPKAKRTARKGNETG